LFDKKDGHSVAIYLGYNVEDISYQERGQSDADFCVDLKPGVI